MPIYTLSAPNGKTYRIEGPAGATQDQIQAEILRRDPSAGQPRRTVADRYQPRARNEGIVGTAINAAARGAAPGGIADRFAAATDAILPGMTAGGHSAYREGLGQAYRHNLANERATTEHNAAQHPITNLLGELAGAAMSPLGLAKRFGNAAYGFTEGFGNSQGSLGHRLAAGAEDAAVSAALGYVAGRALRPVGRVLAPKFSAAAQHLINKGVNLTPGQLAGGGARAAEEKAMSLPGLGHLIRTAHGRSLTDWNKAILGDVLKGADLPYEGKLGHEGLAEVGDKLSAKYDTLLPKMHLVADEALQKDVAGIARDVRDLPPDVQRTFDNIIGNRLMSRARGKAELSGDEVKKIDAEIGRSVRMWRGSPDPAHRELAYRLEDVQRALRGGLERSNPRYGEELRRLNGAWAMFTRVRDAATRRATGHAIFTPSDLLSAVKRGDRSVGKGSFGRGEALLQKEAETAHEILGHNVPNSGTFDRLAAGAALVEAPHILGMAAAHPLAAGAAGLAAGAYTKPGMRGVNRIARAAAQPSPARNALADLVSRASPMVGNAIGRMSGSAGNALAQMMGF